MVKRRSSRAPLGIVELNEQVIKVSFGNSITKLRIWCWALWCSSQQVFCAGIVCCHVCTKPLSHGAVAHISIRLDIEVKTINDTCSEWTRASPSSWSWTKNMPQKVRKVFTILIIGQDLGRVGMTTNRNQNLLAFCLTVRNILDELTAGLEHLCTRHLGSTALVAKIC